MMLLTGNQRKPRFGVASPGCRVQTARAAADPDGMRGKRLLAVGCVAGLAFGLPALSAAAVTAPTPVTYSGAVKKVQDGDTFQMDVYGDGTATWQQFRNADINTPEMVDPVTGKPQCQAVAAGSRTVSRLTTKTLNSAGQWVWTSNKVQVYSTNPAARSLGRRIGVPYYYSAGTWKNLNRELAQSGLAMWMPIAPAPGESTSGSRNAWWDSWYAYGKRVGLFNPTGCGSDQPTAVLSGWLDWDKGNRSQAEGEAIVLRNTGTVAVDLTGWSLRSGHPESYRAAYRFPAGLRLAPGDLIRLHFGSGTGRSTLLTTAGTDAARTDGSFGWQPDTAYRQHDLYLNGVQGTGLSDPTDTVTTWAMFYLQDRYQNVRALPAAPCGSALGYGLTSCADPRKGAFSAAAVAPAGDITAEHVDFTVSRPLDVSGLSVVTKPYSWAWAMPLPDNLRLQPGDLIRVHPGRGAAWTSGRTTHVYLGLDPLGSSGWFGAGGWVGIRSHTDETVGCVSWGGVACPSRLR